jgi:hypothetical protein
VHLKGNSDYDDPQKTQIVTVHPIHSEKFTLFSKAPKPPADDELPPYRRHSLDDFVKSLRAARKSIELAPRSRQSLELDRVNSGQHKGVYLQPISDVEQAKNPDFFNRDRGSPYNSKTFKRHMKVQ